MSNNPLWGLMIRVAGEAAPYVAQELGRRVAGEHGADVGRELGEALRETTRG